MFNVDLFVKKYSYYIELDYSDLKCSESYYFIVFYFMRLYFKIGQLIYFYRIYNSFTQALELCLFIVSHTVANKVLVL